MIETALSFFDHSMGYLTALNRQSLPAFWIKAMGTPGSGARQSLVARPAA
jgi:hypothetical protein